jgi:thymidylate synthase
MSVNQIYASVLKSIIGLGNLVTTRNSETYMNPFLDNITFDEFPLVTVRKTAWKSAISEMEWFFSGETTCPDNLLKWWDKQLSPDNRLLNGYASQLRYSTFLNVTDDGQKLQFFDQIKYILDGLKNHPHSRRLVTTTWNTGEMASITQANNNSNSPSTCFPAWVKVLTKNGYRNIADIKPDELIWNGDDYIPVIAVTPKGVQNVYCAETNFGNLYATLDHKVSDGETILPLRDAKRLEICATPESRLRNNGVKFTIEITDLKIHSTEEVFDITVDSHDHLLYCDGFKVSNCHGSLTQFFVVDDYLHVKTYSRSSDLLLGVPHNWVQYYAVLKFFAFHSNLNVGNLIWVFGDAHVYNEESHIQTANEIIENSTSQSESDIDLEYNYSGEIDEFGTPKFLASDFTITGTIPQPIVTGKPKLL